MIFPCFSDQTEIGHRVRKVGPADEGAGASRRLPVERGLKGEDPAQLAADPPRDGDGFAEFFQECGAHRFQGLLMGNAVQVTRKRFLLQNRAEKRCQKERRRGVQSASGQPVEALQVRIQQVQVIVVSSEPPNKSGEEGGQKSAGVQQSESRSGGTEQKEFQDLFIESGR